MTIVISITAACKKDNKTIKIESHDKNLMMNIKHQMMTEMMGNDPDNDFAMMMRVHHQGAINTANRELQNGDDAAMKELAQMIDFANPDDWVPLKRDIKLPASINLRVMSQR